MQEKWNELQVVLEQMKTMKKREYFLTLAVCVLSGLVIGMLFSPKKRIMIGSNNKISNLAGEDEFEDLCGCDCDCEK